MFISGFFNRPQQQQQPQVVYQQAPPKKSGIGLGGAAALGKYHHSFKLRIILMSAPRIGIGGLAAGALLENAWDDHEDREEEQAYDQGMHSRTLHSS